VVYDIVGSIVLFQNDINTAAKAVDSFLDSGLKIYLYLVDNSPTDILRKLASRPNTEYIFNRGNIGFGAGHNIALRKAIGQAKYSLIMNPDVYFDKGVLEKLSCFMEERPDVGSVMPKVLFPDKSLQYLCRLLPTPLDILLRKIDFKIFNFLFKERKSRYELKFADYNRIMNVPYLSGCFMLLRTKLLEDAGVFDERFFLYFEDVDLARRFHRLSDTIYYPDAVIYHNYERRSGKDMVLFRHLIASGIKYFNKWGWFFDAERKQLNSKALKDINYLG
jgi:GT2 family glycosyltransferase